MYIIPYECIGFDIERHDYGTGGYPGQLVLQDVLTLHGSQNHGGSSFAIGSPGQTNLGQNPDGRKVPGLNWSGSDRPGYKAQAFNSTAARQLACDPMARTRGQARKAASAQIAKIPFPLAQWIARCYKPESVQCHRNKVVAKPVPNLYPVLKVPDTKLCIGCGIEFVPVRDFQKYHNRTCKLRTWKANNVTPNEIKRVMRYFALKGVEKRKLQRANAAKANRRKKAEKSAKDKK